MDFILRVPDTLKPLLNKLSIDDVSLYVNTDYDIDLKFQTTHIIISKETLYIINENPEKIITFKREEIDEIKADYLLDYGRIYIIKDNKYTHIANFSKAKTRFISLFEKYGIKVLNNKMSDEDYHSKDIYDLSLHVCPTCGKPYDANSTYCKDCQGKSSTIKRLFQYSKKYKKLYLFITFLLLLSCVLGIIIPIFTSKILYNEFLDSSGAFAGKILLFTIVFLILQVIGMIINIIYGRTLASTSAQMCFDMKNDVFEAMQRLSLKFFQDKQTGNLMNRIVWDVNMVFYFIVDNIPHLFINILKIVGMFVYLMILNPQLCLFIIIPIPFVMLIYLKVFPKFRQNWEQNFARENNLTSMVSDTLEGFRVVKVFSESNSEMKKFDKVSNGVKKANSYATRYRSLVMPLIQFFINCTIFIIWGYGGHLVIQGGMDYGDFTVFIAGVELLYTPLESLTSLIFMYTPRVLNSARRVFEIIDSNADLLESDNPVKINDIKGDIEFKDVTFSYEPNKVILKDISFALKANHSLGIVGKTGVGKSTLMNMLSRLYDVDSGSITIDGVNIKDIDFATLHKNVSMISQDTYLFKGSIMDNIKYAKSDATHEDVIEAAKTANAHEFIMKLPNGYDTLIGEGQITLSGGEKQRISIARAVLLNAKIIIFDEATAAMDTITERAIQESINKIKDGKTILMIAHRLSTLKDVDSLIVIDNKQIIERGTMDELIALNGEFAKLYNIQKEALKHITIGD